MTSESRKLEKYVKAVGDQFQWEAQYLSREDFILGTYLDKLDAERALIWAWKNCVEKDFNNIGGELLNAPMKYDALLRELLSVSKVELKEARSTLIFERIGLVPKLVSGLIVSFLDVGFSIVGGINADTTRLAEPFRDVQVAKLEYQEASSRMSALNNYFENHKNLVMMMTT